MPVNPKDALEEAAAMRFPCATDNRLRELMNANTEGRLTAKEKEELEALVQISEMISLAKAKALLALGRRPA
jgi:hypothetical protein